MTASKMTSLMCKESVFNSFKCSSSREKYSHVSRDGWELSSTGAYEILFPLQISRNSPRKTFSAFPPHVKQEGALPPPNFVMVFTSWLSLLFCTAASSQPPLRSTSLAPLFRAELLVWHCSHFFSFHRMWARKGSGKDSLVSCYPDLKDFSFLLSCIAGEESQPESSLCARPVLGHCTQQEKGMSI